MRISAFHFPHSLQYHQNLVTAKFLCHVYCSYQQPKEEKTYFPMKNSLKSLANFEAIFFTYEEKNQRLFLEAKFSQTRDFFLWTSKQLVCLAQIDRYMV